MKLAPALTLAGCLIVAGQARAERTSDRLTPEKTATHLYSFTIKVEREKDSRGKFLTVRVTVEPKDAQAKRLPLRYGRLEVFNGEEFVSSCDVKPTGGGGRLSFSFQVAEGYAEKSTFTFAEAVELADGEQGFYHWFYLKDFKPR